MDRPNAPELLHAIKTTLGSWSDLPADEARYLGRIMSNLCDILSREFEHGDDVRASTVVALSPLLTSSEPRGDTPTAPEVSAAVDAGLASGQIAADRATFEALHQDVCARLSLARPDYR